MRERNDGRERTRESGPKQKRNDDKATKISFSFSLSFLCSLSLCFFLFLFSLWIRKNQTQLLQREEKQGKRYLFFKNWVREEKKTEKKTKNDCGGDKGEREFCFFSFPLSSFLRLSLSVSFLSLSFSLNSGKNQQNYYKEREKQGGRYFLKKKTE